MQFWNRLCLNTELFIILDLKAPWPLPKRLNLLLYIALRDGFYSDPKYRAPNTQIPINFIFIMHL